jgi:hypothetical protein
VSDSHAFDRYNKACETLNHIRDGLRERSDSLSRVAAKLRATSPSLKIEELHAWQEIKDDPEKVVKADWLGFDELKSLVSNWERAVAEEDQAWKRLSASQQARVKRCT